MSEKVRTAELTKKDFDKVLAERQRQHIDNKISQIITFDLFKGVAKRRLRNTFQFFFNSKTLEPYVKQRNQFLYRQGDQPNGIFCILEGQVKRINEPWAD